MVHAFLHIVVPGLVALAFYRPRWRRVWLVLAAALLLDLDHLWATPFYDPDRCIINFHTFHTYWAIGFYMVLLFPTRTRVWAVGFLLHMVLDYTECWQRGIYLP
ncbi:peptidoglycan/LPS O-acetylase OafA/YrhL [Hymenobacter luteus]|uniref:Peptidoglycan/LPS O-acetylase OafA/YrhL n=2 Tax=Hymenobacter TaxID=89966 RepID=A0A7W9WCU9_9BACT|nr:MULTISPECIES: DUF6122 family protein [Hymenobacter]MBB4603528.1 peptidoglycan/LPS O-acetylase OafA/YrhL [Hymenobacter latericoloratus]MBB6061299.1 peptidoglycan/LPS O-acetylase OafA/YrhL [Hymenobacter luteus]